MRSGLLQIVLKDLLLLARDRRTFVLLLAMPIVFIAILGVNTGRLVTGRDSNQIELVFVDQDGSPLAEWILESIAEDPRIRTRRLDSVQEAERRVQEGEATAAVIIGPDFSRRAGRLEPIDLIDLPDRRLAEGLSSLDIRVRSKTPHAVFRLALAQLVFSRAAQVLARHVISRWPVADRYIRSQPEVPAGQRGITRSAEVDPVFGDLVQSAQDIYLTLVPSYTVMFAFFLITLMARNLLAERQNGTLLRLQLAPLRPAGVVLGKTIPFFGISILQGLLMFLAGRWFFGMSWGDAPGLLLAVIVSTSWAVTGLGLLTARLARSEAQVVAYGSFLVIGLAAFSGCIMPREIMPRMMQQLSLITPHAWALIAYDEILTASATDWGRVGTSCGVLLAFGSLFLGLGLGLFAQRRPRPPSATTV